LLAALGGGQVAVRELTGVTAREPVAGRPARAGAIELARHEVGGADVATTRALVLEPTVDAEGPARAGAVVLAADEPLGLAVLVAAAVGLGVAGDALG